MVNFGIYTWSATKFFIWGIGCLVCGLTCYFYSKYLIRDIFQKNIDIFCILEAYYISIDLSNNSILSNENTKLSLEKRIKNLSRLILIKKKRKNSSVQSKNYFTEMSKATYSASEWLETAQDSTLFDLRKYFDKFFFYFVTGKIGNVRKIEIYCLLLEQHKYESKWKILNKLISKIDLFLEKTIEFIGKLIDLLKKFKDLFK